MTLSNKNRGHAFLVRLDIFSVIMKRVPVPVVSNFNDLSIKHLIKLTLQEYDLKP